MMSSSAVPVTLSQRASVPAAPPPAPAGAAGAGWWPLPLGSTDASRSIELPAQPHRGTWVPPQFLPPCSLWFRPSSSSALRECHFYREDRSRGSGASSASCPPPLWEVPLFSSAPSSVFPGFSPLKVTNSGLCSLEKLACTSWSGYCPPEATLRQQAASPVRSLRHASLLPSRRGPLASGAAQV